MSVIEQLEPKVVTPDVYGNTPFQRQSTVEPSNTVIFVVRPEIVGLRQFTASAVARVPALPGWMVASR